MKNLDVILVRMISKINLSKKFRIKEKILISMVLKNRVLIICFFFIFSVV